MHKEILEIVRNISLWMGDVYKLAALVAEKQREIDECAALIAEKQREIDKSEFNPSVGE